MWFDVDAARAGRPQPPPAPANLARAANLAPQIAGLARLAAGSGRADDTARPPAPDLADLLDAAEERAAIMEYGGGLTREEAERLTLAAVTDFEAAQILRSRWHIAAARDAGIATDPPPTSHEEISHDQE